MNNHIKRIFISEYIQIKWIGFSDGETYVEIIDNGTCPISLYGECLH